MTDVKIVGRGVDTLVLNVSYADLQEELNSQQGEARINESPIVTRWAFWPIQW